MINKLSNWKFFLFLISMQVAIGLAGIYVPVLVGIVYTGLFLIFALDVIINKDEGSRAGFYALYLMGFEIVYRMVGATFSYELGKYLSSLILIVGAFSGRRKDFPWIFIFCLLLLVPALFLAKDPDPVRIRKMILFNLSGPLCIVFSGMYFYKRVIIREIYLKGLQFAFLPAFSLIVFLSMKAGINTLQFDSVSSNPEASGGFGANQVSSVIGWFILLILLVKVQRFKITPFNWLDWCMLAILFVRGLLTMSRGGMMSAAFALLGALVVYFYTDYLFRRRFIKMLPYIVMGLVFLSAVTWYANKVSNNYVFYRYQGRTTNEVLTGTVDENKNYLTGRDEIMEGDLAAFLEYPLLGVGYGMSTSYHLAYFGSAAAAHTEFARLLSENGSLGLLYMLILFIALPVRYLFKVRSNLSKYFMAALFLISMMTMFHGAMRLSLAGILYGAAFIIVVESKKDE